MSLDAAELRRQEQMLLACMENLQAAAAKTEALGDGIRQAWHCAETPYLLQAVDKALSELSKEKRLAESLAEEVSDKGARLRVQAEILGESSFLESGDGLF